MPSSTISCFAASSKSVDITTATLTQHSISRLPNRKPAKEFAYDSKEIFDNPDSAKPKNKKACDEAGKYLQEDQFGLSMIAGSDEKGDSDKLRLLTAALAIVECVKAIGLGNTKPNLPTSSSLSTRPPSPLSTPPIRLLIPASFSGDGQRRRNLNGRRVEEVIRFTRRVHFFC